MSEKDVELKEAIGQGYECQWIYIGIELIYEIIKKINFRIN